MKLVKSLLLLAVLAVDATAADLPICDRTMQVREAIVASRAVSDCSAITSAHLSAITTLDLRSRGIASLKNGDFAGLDNLQTLHLHNNNLTSLAAGLFVGLTKLKSLGLSHNQISNPPVDLFADTVNLHTLDLSNNTLDSLPPRLFAGLTKLAALYLDYNELSNLPAGLFAGLVSCEILNLSHNNLDNLPVRLLSDLEVLRNVYLSFNELDQLPADLFAGLAMLSDLSLNNNPGAPFAITAEPVRADALETATNTATVRIALSHHIPSALTFTTNITNGKIRSTTWAISAGAMFSLTQKIAQATINQRTFVTITASLPSLPFGYRGLEIVKGENLPLFTSTTPPVFTPIAPLNFGIGETAWVATLDDHVLVHNGRAPSTWTFSVAREGVVAVSLVGDRLSVAPLAAGSTTITITATDKEGLTATLAIGATVHIDGFCGRTLQVRTAVVATSDGVRDCASVTDAVLASIRTLNLSASGITDLQNGDFAGFSGLRILNMSANELETLPTGLFAGLVNLQYLGLDDNRISSLPAEIFAELSALQTLYLQNNKLQALAQNLFVGPSNLTNLNLNYNSGSPFVIRSQLMRTDGVDSAASPAMARIILSHHTPYHLTFTGTVYNGTASGATWTIPAGARQSREVVAITQAIEGRHTVIVGQPIFPPNDGIIVETIVLPIFVQGPPPTAVGSISPPKIAVIHTIDVSAYFVNNSPVADLRYNASSTAPAIATATITVTTVTIRPVAEGTATITITASDDLKRLATQTFVVTVVPFKLRDLATDNTKSAIVLIRYLFGSRGPALVHQQTLLPSTTIAARIAQVAAKTQSPLDVDRNNTVNTKDGTLILRYLLNRNIAPEVLVANLADSRIAQEVSARIELLFAQ